MKITSNNFNQSIKQKNNEKNSQIFYAKNEPSFGRQIKLEKNYVEIILNYLKNLIKTKIKPTQIVETGTVSEVKKTTVEVKKTVETKLPFNPIQRLKHNKIDEEHFHTFLTSADKNKEHFNFLMRMKKAGMDERYICEIFDSCKNQDGKLKMPLYHCAMYLNEKGIKSSNIKPTILNFRLTFNKFDYESFNKFLEIKDKVINKTSKNEGAFCNLAERTLNDFFFTHQRAIKTATRVVGEETFLGLTELEPKTFYSTIKEIQVRSRVKIAKQSNKAFIGDSVLPHS